MQDKLPISGQNSHLYTIVSGGRVNVMFVYADYEANTSFSHYLVQPLSSDFEISHIDEIISDIISVWGGDFGLDLRGDSSGIMYAIFYQSGEIGGSTLLVDSKYYQEGFRSNILNCIARPYSSDERLDSAMKYMKAYNPSDLLWVCLDWDRILVYSISRIGGSDSIDVDLREFTIENNLSQKNIIDKLENVVGIHIEKENILNILANVIDKQIISSNSNEVWDVVRSYITTNLIKFRDPVFKNFGVKTNDAHLVITGNMSSVLSKETLFISIIDGLQLRGRYRVVIDQDQKSVIAQVSLGSKDFVIPLDELYSNRFLYFSSESESKVKLGDLAFEGKLESNVGNEDIQIREIMGQVGHFHTLNLSGNGRISIKPSRSVYFPNLPKEGKNLIASFLANDVKAVVDCRRIPVVYGPDENANSERIMGWINGLKLSKEH